jgi:uncharacterized repeat protein (TIGR03803 family)
MKRIQFANAAFIVALVCVAGAFATAQTFTSYNLDGDVVTPLVQGFDGNLYGTSATWHNQPTGVVFKMTPTGTMRILHTFCEQANCPDGSDPEAGLFLAPNGNFYGTTVTGGANNNAVCNDNNAGCGTIFEITPGGKFTTLYNFCSLANCADGALPKGALVQGNNGNLYGTTLYGGICASCGTVFTFTRGGQLTTLYNFCSQANCADGEQPDGLLLVKGVLYGTTQFGGLNNTGLGLTAGTIFQITPNGTLTTIHQFCSVANCGDGAEPFGGLIWGSDGELYGTTLVGGANQSGTVFTSTLVGAGFTTLYEFCQAGGGCSDGSGPNGVIQASDGNLYGTTGEGGTTSGDGTIFELSSTGLTTLHSFCTLEDGDRCTDGAFPQASLVQDTSGAFYGTTSLSGNPGAIFSISTGLGPLVVPNPSFGKVGESIAILGTDLTGATSVTFNGVAATTFTVESATLIKATVPSGATTGTVEVTTPSGTLTSTLQFQVQ